MPQLIATVKGVEVRHVHLRKDRTTLGRKPDNDIVLDTLVVSGHHCAFDLVGVADVFVVDLGSTNGTYVNDRMARDRTRLADGDVIAIGPYRIRYLQASEEPTSHFGTTSFQTSLQAPSFPASGLQALQASFTVLTGSSAGLEVPVVKAVTTFGKPGVSVVSVAQRRGAYYVTHLGGETPPLLNANPVGTDPLLLSDRDVLDLAGTQMRFQLGG